MTSSSHGHNTSVFLDDAAGNRVNLIALALVEHGGLDEGINLLRRQSADLFRRRSAGEEPSRSHDHHLVERADRDDAGDQLRERRVVAFFRQLEQRGFGKEANRLLNTFQSQMNIEILFHGRYLMNLLLLSADRTEDKSMSESAPIWLFLSIPASMKSG